VLHHSNALAAAVDAHAHVFDPAFPFAADRHYTPGPAPLDAYLAQATAWGTEKVVLVQPSPYGADNSALCVSLQQLGTQRARGIAVIDRTTSAAEIDELMRWGVVGVRLNLEAGAQSQPELLTAELEALLEQVADHRLAVQLFVDATALEAVAGLLATAPVPVILDHFAGVKAARGMDQPGLEAVVELMGTGKVWVKFSGPYRSCPHQVDLPVLGSIAARFVEANEDRIVWGSDWPHTGGGRVRPARPITEVEPFRAHDPHVFLTQIAQWVGTEQRYQKLLVSNPHVLFQF
jgi:2-pyrone-4,6-dicarboxylate lactonase